MTAQEDETLDSNEDVDLKGFRFLFAFVALFPLMLKEVKHTFWLPLISAIAIFLFAVTNHKRLTNVTTFSILLFLVSVGFPLIHYGLFKLGKDNYRIEGDLLEKKSKALVEESSNHINLKQLNSLVNLKDSLLDKNIDKVNTANIYRVNDYMLMVKYKPLPEAVTKEVLVYDSLGTQIGILDAGESTIRKCLIKELNLLNEMNIEARNPVNQIEANDFWIESITSFSFGSIKANSTLVKFVRALQYLVIFLFAAMVTNTIRAMDVFIMRKKT